MFLWPGVSPAHGLLRPHRLRAECFTTGVPDKVKDRWFEQVLPEDWLGMLKKKYGIHQKCQGVGVQGHAALFEKLIVKTYLCWTKEKINVQVSEKITSQ